jgi:hypothetical protein
MIVPKIKNKDFNVLFLLSFGFFYHIWRVRQDFSTSYADFIGSKLQPCEIASYIKENKMQLIFLARLTEKFYCAHSPFALNELNLALTL